MVLCGWLLLKITSDAVSSNDFSIFTLFDLGYHYFYIGGATLFFFFIVAVILLRLVTNDYFLLLQRDGFRRNSDIIYNRKIYWSEVKDIYLLQTRLKGPDFSSLFKSWYLAIVFHDPENAIMRSSPLNKENFKVTKKYNGEYFLLDTATAAKEHDIILQEFQRYWQAWQEWEEAKKDTDGKGKPSVPLRSNL